MNSVAVTITAVAVKTTIGKAITVFMINHAK